MEYHLVEVIAEPYKDDEDNKNFFTLNGKFFVKSKNREVTKRIAVVNFDNCRIIYDSISCPKDIFEEENQRVVLAKAVEVLLGYYYGQSKHITNQIDSIGNELNKLCNMSTEYAKSSIFDVDTKKKLVRRADSIKTSLTNADEYYKQIHEYIILYVYTTIFKTLCKKDVNIFASAINGSYTENETSYTFTDGYGLVFTIVKEK